MTKLFKNKNLVRLLIMIAVGFLAIFLVLPILLQQGYDPFGNLVWLLLLADGILLYFIRKNKTNFFRIPLSIIAGVLSLIILAMFGFWILFTNMTAL